MSHAVGIGIWELWQVSFFGFILRFEMELDEIRGVYQLKVVGPRDTTGWHYVYHKFLVVGFHFPQRHHHTSLGQLHR